MYNISGENLTKVKEILPLLTEVKENGGTVVLYFNKKGSIFSRETKKPEKKKCRILKILYKKQQTYLLVTSITDRKAKKISVGEGTRVLNTYSGNQERKL